MCAAYEGVLESVGKIFFSLCFKVGKCHPCKDLAHICGRNHSIEKVTPWFIRMFNGQEFLSSLKVFIFGVKLPIVSKV